MESREANGCAKYLDAATELTPGNPQLYSPLLPNFNADGIDASTSEPESEALGSKWKMKRGKTQTSLQKC
jgi:hypothetical protein